MGCLFGCVFVVFDSVCVGLCVCVIVGRCIGFCSCACVSLYGCDVACSYVCMCIVIVCGRVFVYAHVCVRLFVCVVWELV